MSHLHFELFIGLPAALAILRRELGSSGLLRLLPRFALRNLVARPFASLGPPDGAKARFSRRQLRPVLVLDDSLRALGLAPARRLEILGAVVAETGARFIAHHLRPPKPEGWAAMDAVARRRFVHEVTDRFGNAELEVLDAPDVAVAFDVSFCHFAAMTQALGRPELAPLFCQADSVYFSRPDAPIRLGRTGTIAEGHARCDFRLRFADAAPGGSPARTPASLRAR